jgi:uncharacterized damage-inducible protein DinB
MTEQERRYLLDEFTASQNRLMALVANLTPEQWTFRPAEDRWSIGDCIEHVTAVEERVMAAIGKHLEHPPESEKRHLAEGKDSLAKQKVPDRSRRIEAPEPVRPKRNWQDPDRLLGEFRARRERTLQFTSSSDGDFRNHFFAHIALGELDCYQWLVVLSLHGGRHAQQIEEIKSDPAFPRAGVPVS